MHAENLPTPPETVVVRRKLLRHRNALADFQANANKDNDTTTDTTTPCELMAKKSDLAFNSPSASDRSESDSTSLEELVLYKNPPLSFLAILAGCLTLSTFRYIVSGPHEVTFLSGKHFYQPTTTILALVSSLSISQSHPLPSKLTIYSYFLHCARPNGDEFYALYLWWQRSWTLARRALCIFSHRCCHENDQLCCTDP